MRYFLIIFLLFTMNLLPSPKIYGQQIESAIFNFETGKFDKAKEIIDEILQKPGATEEPENQYWRGRIYEAIAGDYRGVFLNLDTVALYKSYDAYIKVQSLSNKGSVFHQKSLAGLDSLRETAINFAGKYYKRAYALIPADRIKNSFVSIDSINKAKALYAFVLNATELAIKLNQKDTLAHNFAIFSALAVDRTDLYIESSEKMISILPKGYAKQKHYETLIANLLNEIKDRKKAAEVLNWAINDFPEVNDFKELQLTLSLQEGDLENGVRVLRARIAENPSEPSNHYNLAMMYHKYFKYSEAIVCYKKCLQLDPSNYDAMYQIGAILYNKAVATLQSTEKLDLSEYTKRGKQVELQAVEEFKEALPYFELTHQLRPGVLDIMGYLYVIYYCSKNTAKANEIRDKIIKTRPDFLKALYKKNHYILRDDETLEKAYGSELAEETEEAEIKEKEEPKGKKKKQKKERYY